MQITRPDATPTQRAPEPTFTGDVQVAGYFRRAAPSRLTGATVAFPPGARTPWKVSPAGQTVVVTDGIGWAQVEGGEVVELRAGDTVWFPPGEWHWEGAAPDQAMTCVALQEGGVEFGAAVTDEEYGKGPGSG